MENKLLFVIIQISLCLIVVVGTVDGMFYQPKMFEHRARVNVDYIDTNTVEESQQKSRSPTNNQPGKEANNNNSSNDTHPVVSTESEENSMAENDPDLSDTNNLKLDKITKTNRKGGGGVGRGLVESFSHLRARNTGDPCTKSNATCDPSAEECAADSTSATGFSCQAKKQSCKTADDCVCEGSAETCSADAKGVKHCTEPSSGPGQACKTSADCASPSTCKGSVCEDPPGKLCSMNGDCCSDPKICEKDPGGNTSICTDSDARAGHNNGSIKHTPNVYYGGNGLEINEDCRLLSEDIDEIEQSDSDPDDKKKSLRGNLEGVVCNWKQARLECLPPVKTAPDTTPSSSATDNDDQASDDPISQKKGKCRCLQALGERAIYIVGTTTTRGVEHGQCFIPAGLGYASKCGHDITIPTGKIDTGFRTYRYVGSSAQFCVPGSTCKIGYSYVGLRCNCDRGHRWIPNGELAGTCESNGQSMISCIPALVILPLFLFPFSSNN